MQEYMTGRLAVPGDAGLFRGEPTELSWRNGEAQRERAAH